MSLEHLYQTIRDTLDEYRVDDQNLALKSASTCVFDKQRSLRLEEVVIDTVSPGDNVLVLGAGLLVDSAAAAYAGAARVYAVEFDRWLFPAMKEIRKRLGYEHVIELILDDVFLYEPCFYPNVISCEMFELGGGFEKGPLVMMKYGHMFQRAKMIPQFMKNYIQPLDQYRHSLGGRILYDEMDFKVDKKSGVDALVEFPDASFARFETDLITTESEVIGSFHCLCDPIEVKAKPDKKNKIRIKYNYGRRLPGRLGLLISWPS